MRRYRIEKPARPMTLGDAGWLLPDVKAAGPSKEEVLLWLQQLQSDGDIERMHRMADDILLEFIRDAEITAAFSALGMWYA